MPIVWLKELAQFLNRKVPVEIADPIFKNKPFDYPLSAVSNLLKNFIFVFNNPFVGAHAIKIRTGSYYKGSG